MSKKSEDQFKWPIIGHSNIVSYLKKCLATNNASHAYLFVGPQGVGKTAVATQFLQEFLGSKNLESHPDALVLSSEDMERESEKFTDYFRGLLGRLGMTSLGGNRKTFFIEEAHALNNNAANALLKTLEEPRGDMLIILRTHNLAAVPATIHGQRRRVLTANPWSLSFGGVVRVSCLVVMAEISWGVVRVWG